MPPRPPQPAPPALDLAEEAMHLLRRAPAATLAFQVVGTLPFAVGLLFFVADMSRSAFAFSHNAPAAFGLALLFVWMKSWQALYCARLAAQAGHQPPPPLTFRLFFRTARNQAILQPAGLILLPLSIVPMLPFAWVFAFYQNLTALDGNGDGQEVAGAESGGPRRLLRRALHQAKLWPGQNHALIAMLFFFAFFVWLNCIVMTLTLPGLLKTFFGLESPFTQIGSGWLALAFIFNTTFWGIVCTSTWLALDPVVKAIYSLRCFYGEARADGADLLGELRGLQIAAGLPRAALLLLLCLPVTALQAQPAPSSAAAKSAAPARQSLLGHKAMAPAALEESMRRVMQRREFAWRLPRGAADAGVLEPGPFERLMQSMIEKVRAGWRAVKRGFVRLINWLNKIFNRKFTPSGDPLLPDADFGLSPKTLGIILTVLALCGLAVILLRRWRGGKRPELGGRTLLPVPDLRDEATHAEQLPESGWLALARQLMAKGDLRLALRALYLASLADLAQRGILTLAQSKSNRDYLREIERRAHGKPGLRFAFDENVRSFERVWYGRHAASAAQIEAFGANLETIKVAADG